MPFCNSTGILSSPSSWLSFSGAQETANKINKQIREYILGKALLDIKVAFICELQSIRSN
jgi:hypothetical protein